jgi:hypothetical protein
MRSYRAPKPIHIILSSFNGIFPHLRFTPSHGLVNRRAERSSGRQNRGAGGTTMVPVPVTNL